MMRSLIRRAGFVAGLSALFAGLGWCQSACDLNHDGTVNIVDVQTATNMLLGSIPCTANIAGPGVCNIVVVQRVTNAALGAACVTDGGTAQHSVTLSWTASTSSGVVGYKVYRGTVSGGPYTVLNSSLVTGTTYADTSVQAGGTYYYVVTAVNSGNQQSAYSSQGKAIVPSP